MKTTTDWTRYGAAGLSYVGHCATFVCWAPFRRASLWLVRSSRSQCSPDGVHRPCQSPTRCNCPLHSPLHRHFPAQKPPAAARCIPLALRRRTTSCLPLRDSKRAPEQARPPPAASLHRLPHLWVEVRCPVRYQARSSPPSGPGSTRRAVVCAPYAVAVPAAADTCARSSGIGDSRAGYLYKPS